MTEAPAEAYLQRAGLTPRPVDWVEPHDAADHAGLAAGSVSWSFQADIAEFQSLYDNRYPYPSIAMRGDNGGRLDYHFADNYHRVMADPKNRLLVVYLVLIEEDPGPVLARLRSVIGAHVPAKVCFRIDVESGSGFAGPGNHSARANQWLSALDAWAGRSGPVDGYANAYDWASGWSNRPASLKRFIASYGSVEPAGAYGWQYYGGLDYPTPSGWPRGCPPFGAWCDMNAIARPIDQIVTDYGGTTPAATTKDDKMIIFQKYPASTGARNPNAVYIFDGLTQRYIPTPAVYSALAGAVRARLGANYDVSVHTAGQPRDQLGTLIGFDPEQAGVLHEVEHVDLDGNAFTMAIAKRRTRAAAAATSAVHRWLLDPLERAGTTFAETLLPTLFAAGGGLALSQHWLGAVDSAAFAALFSLVSAYILLAAKLPTRGVVDVIRRLGITFAASLAGVMTAAGAVPSVAHANWRGAAAIALAATLASALKILASGGNGALVDNSVIPLSMTEPRYNSVDQATEPLPYSVSFGPAGVGTPMTTNTSGAPAAPRLGPPPSQ